MDERWRKQGPTRRTILESGAAMGFFLTAGFPAMGRDMSVAANVSKDTGTTAADAIEITLNINSRD